MNNKRYALEHLAHVLRLLVELNNCKNTHRIRGLRTWIRIKSEQALLASTDLVSLDTLDDDNIVIYLSAMFLVSEGENCLLNNMNAVHVTLSAVEALINGNSQEAA